MTVSARRLSAEFLGTGLLLFIIVGSGIALTANGGSADTFLLAHAVAVGAGLAALIAFLSPVSGAHFNPVVTLGLALTGDMQRGERFAFVTAQILGAVSGVVVANAVFGASWLAISGTSRSGLGQVSSELVVTFVLVLLIVGLVRSDRTGFIPAAVGAWIVAIIVASPSTGFANPAVTIARIVTDTVTGIAPGSAPAFLVAQVVGGALGGLTAIALFPSSRSLNDTTPDILEDAP